MNTSKSSARILLAATSLVVLASVSSSAEDAVREGRWSAQEVRAGDEACWTAAAKDNAAERRAIAAGLLGVARDTSRGDLARGGAILQLGEVPTSEGMQFCAKHVSESFDQFAGSSRLSHRYFPCRGALVKAGWMCVPSCLSRLTAAEIPEDDVKNLAFVLRKVAGPVTATALVSGLEESHEEQSRRLGRAVQYIKTYEPPMHIPPPPPPPPPPRPPIPPSGQGERR